MIFAKTLDLVLSGRKKQTCRPCHLGDRLLAGEGGAAKVVDDRGRLRWRVGGEYAVQPGRCQHARARMRVMSLRRIEDPTAVDDAFARAEGFDSLAGFLATWRELHRKEPVLPVWVIGFEMVPSTTKTKAGAAA